MAPDDNNKLPLFGPGSMTATLTYADSDFTDGLGAGDDADQLVSGYFYGLGWSALDGGSLSIAPDIASGNPTSADPVTGMGQGIDTPASSPETISAVPGASASTGGDFNAASNSSFAYQTLAFVDASQQAAAPAGGQAQQLQPPTSISVGFIYDGTNYTPVYVPGSLETHAVSINDQGEVTGNYYEPGSPFLGFVYSNGNYTTIDVPGSEQTTTVSINNSNEVAGWYVTNTSFAHGFTYDNGTYTTIDVPGGLSTTINSMNAAGEVAGYYSDGSGVSHGFTYNGSTYTTIDPPGSNSTGVASINDQGEGVGNYVNSSFQDLGFVYNNGAYTTLDVPGSTETQAASINNSNEVAGNYFSNGQEFGYVYNNGSYTTLDVPGSYLTSAVSINDQGEVVGEYANAIGQDFGYVYSNGSYTTLDVPGGTDITPADINNAGEVAGNYTTAPCYCPGTLILTERGEVAVEALAIGDRVMTMSGAGRPIKWIGRRSYAGRFALGRPNILPICVQAGALDDGVPRRDLWVSPHHAMCLEGVLIEACDLVNGITIFQAEQVAQVEYFHIELDTHDVLIAEGAYSESFVDDDSRGLFHNAHEYRALYPDERTQSARYCAPRCREGLAVERAQQAIARRAGLPDAVVDLNVGALRGFIDGIGPQRIQGWAQHVDQPEMPAWLDILADGKRIGHVVANRYRADLVRAGMGSGRHGFAFEPPPGVSLGAIEVRRSHDGAALPLSKALAQRPSIRPQGCRGYLDRLSRTRVKGWALDDRQPEAAPVSLLILANDRRVGRVAGKLAPA
jgi:hypothetical protein